MARLIVREDLQQVVRGVMMGCADIVPGVSGGTVALILGIYERLVGAISRFDLYALRLVRAAKFREAAAYVDLRFLVFLGLGIATALLALGSTMHFLLENHRERTLAAFFGMIVASTLLVARRVDRWTPPIWAFSLAGLVFAFWLVGLPVFKDPPRGLGWIFLCGAVAICAMILPGISGAFILLILGKYYEVTTVLKEFAQLRFSGHDVALVLTFAAGAIVGLLSFSRLLRALLTGFHAATMAVLAGFMIGSLRRIWPFQSDLTPLVTELKHKDFANVWPMLSDSGTWATVLVAVVAGAAVIVLERIASERSVPE